MPGCVVPPMGPTATLCHILGANTQVENASFKVNTLENHSLLSILECNRYSAMHFWTKWQYLKKRGRVTLLTLLTQGTG